MNAKIIVPYNTIINPPNQTCPISLTRFEPDSSNNVMVIRYCGHVFVPEDLRQWFTRSVRCPLCRYDIRRTSRATESDNVNNYSDIEEIENEEENININIDNITTSNTISNTNLNDISNNNDRSNNTFNNNMIRTITRTFESNNLRDLSQQIVEAFSNLEETLGNDASNNLLHAIINQINDNDNNE